MVAGVIPGTGHSGDPCSVDDRVSTTHDPDTTKLIVPDERPVQCLRHHVWMAACADCRDARLMVWWHAPSAEALQEAYGRLRRTALGRHLEPVWSQMALHRPAEFNRSHIPAFLADEEPRRFVCVYPFVRSYEWYLLPDEERRAMLAEHGRMARGYPDVRANTVASFALGDYEWMLAFEADELHRIVDLMRDLRASAARRHVREEVPFFTGRRRSVAELVAALP